MSFSDPDNQEFLQIMDDAIAAMNEAGDSNPYKDMQLMETSPPGEYRDQQLENCTYRNRRAKCRLRYVRQT